DPPPPVEDAADPAGDDAPPAVDPPPPVEDAADPAGDDAPPAVDPPPPVEDSADPAGDGTATLPEADAPTLGVMDAGGGEDTAIPLSITAGPGDPSETLSITISDVPAGASLSAGARNADGTWTLAPDQLSGLTVTPPADTDADFTLTVTAASHDGEAVASTTATLAVTVEAVADAPVLSASATVEPGAGSAFPEDRVNTTINHDQRDPQVTALEDGGYVVVWTSNDANKDVFGQRYDAAGHGVGGEFRVNTHMSSHQDSPSVTGLKDGGFVVAWTSQGQDKGGDGIYAQRFDAAGHAAGGEFHVNEYKHKGQAAPHVAATPGGGFVVVWQSDGQDTAKGADTWGIFGQRYDVQGHEVGSEFRVNTTTIGDQNDADIAVLADGGYVVTWQSAGQDGSGDGVYAQLFNAQGQALGGETRINATTGGDQADPSITALKGGGYVVTWRSTGQDGSGDGVFGQAYDAQGHGVGAEFQVNTTTAGDQEAPQVAATEDGGFVVSWTGTDADQTGILAQRFDAQGHAVGHELHVNASSDHAQGASDVAGLKGGGFTVVWESENSQSQNPGFDIHTQQHDAAGGHGDAPPVVVLDIRSVLGDTDGSERLGITITNVPSGATLSAGTDLGHGMWSLTPDDLDGLTLTPPEGAGPFTLTVTATSIDAGGASASTSQELAIDPTTEGGIFTGQPLEDDPFSAMAPAEYHPLMAYENQGGVMSGGNWMAGLDHDPSANADQDPSLTDLNNVSTHDDDQSFHHLHDLARVDL
ncbi:MAG TPA: hypothetical protein VEB64_08190, partial [Azospirillaceae bacterium]|nr:hypothetical protein [Azospirillaceae bacterium]